MAQNNHGRYCLKPNRKLHNLLRSVANPKSTLQLDNDGQTAGIIHETSTTKKQGRTRSEYFRRMKGYADQLALIGRPVDETQLMIYILGGLGVEFNNFVTAITARTEPLTLTQLHDFLLGHEHRLEQQAASEYSNIALIAARSGNGGDIYKGKQTAVNSLVSNLSMLGLSLVTGQSSNFGPSLPNNYGASLPNNSFLMGQQQNSVGSILGLGPQSVPENIIKTLCEAFAAQYVRFINNSRGCGKRGKGGTHRGKNNNGYGGHGGQYSNGGHNGGYHGKGVKCQLCSTHGHDALNCPRRYEINPPLALMAESSDGPSDGWFLDSGASNHMMADLNSLSSHFPYQGPKH